MRIIRFLFVCACMLATTAFAQSFKLSSTDIRQGGRIGAPHILNSMGCTGDNLSPELQWSGAPAGTKSFAVTVYDPDAPTGSGFWHWSVYNIPPAVTRLERGAGDASRNLVPAGAVQGNTDFGTPGYGGPCPPPGKPHHYVFTVFALNTDKIDVPANATAAFVRFNVYGHKIATATLTALYSR